MRFRFQLTIFYFVITFGIQVLPSLALPTPLPPPTDVLAPVRDLPILNTTLGKLFGELGNFTRTQEQVADCYADRLGGEWLNLFDGRLSVERIALHYYNAYPTKKATNESVTYLLENVEKIIRMCLVEKQHTARWGLTHMSDWNPNPHKLNSTAHSHRSGRQMSTFDFDRPECSADEITSIPTRFDWRDRHAVTKPKEQRGWTCYIYAAVGAIESAMLVFNRTLHNSYSLDLSERQLADCIVNGHHLGGYAEDAFEYVLRNGIAYEEDYSTAKGGWRWPSWWWGAAEDYYYEEDYYSDEDLAEYAADQVVDQPVTAANPRRHFEYHPGCAAAKVPKLLHPLKGYCVKSYRNEVGARIIPDRVIQQHLLKFGPLYMASSTYYYNLIEGVVDDPYCGVHRGYLDHAILLVGYDEHTWLVKNSFGDDYAENGFYRIARHDRNVCGINTELAFALV